MKPVIEFQIQQPGKIPTRATEGSIGWDVYVPWYVHIDPNQPPRLIPLNIRSAIPKGFAVIVKEKSGLALKGLCIMAGVIDSDYRGEWGIVVRNVGAKSIEILAGGKIAQFILVKDENPMVVEVTSLDETVRGEGGFGSTG